MSYDFHIVLKQIRYKLGYTQKEFAIFIGIHKATYSALETGKRKPSLLSSKKIIDKINALNLDDVQLHYKDLLDSKLAA